MDRTNDNILTIIRETTKAMETRNYKEMHELAARVEVRAVSNSRVWRQ